MSDRIPFLGAAEADQINTAFRQLFAQARPKVVADSDRLGGVPIVQSVQCFFHVGQKLGIFGV